ncbi:MAG: GNAT family protein [Thermoanaerobaculaceae bacterium]|jgi:RimJ/RimL family protein N-acetyltransferase
MGFGWEGEKVRLVPLEKERHLANAVVWPNDPAVTEWTLIGDTPIARLAEEELFDRMMRGDAAEITFAVETLAGEHIGFTGLHRIDYRHGVALTGSVIGRRDLWGQGLGTDMARTRTRYAFEVLGLRMLLSEALEGNEASIRMLTRCGYAEVGRIPRRYFKRGAYRDAILLAIERG